MRTLYSTCIMHTHARTDDQDALRRQVGQPICMSVEVSVGVPLTRRAWRSRGLVASAVELRCPRLRTCPAGCTGRPSCPSASRDETACGLHGRTHLVEHD